MGFSLCHLDHTPGGGTWGCLWVKFFFCKHGHVTYQMEGDGEQIGEQVKCSPYGQTYDLKVKSIGQSLNFLENVGCLRWHPIDYAIASTLIFLDVSKFGDDCSIAHLASHLHQQLVCGMMPTHWIQWKGMLT